MNSEISAWAASVIGHPVKSTSQMDGSTSSTLYQLETDIGAFVVRLFDNAEWLADEPDLARHEAAALQKAAQTGLPCPEVIAFDEMGDVCGVPLLLMTLLPGVVELKPVDLDDWLYQQAEALARIHAMNADEFPWSYRPWYDADKIAVPSWSALEDEWARAIEIVLGPEPAYRPVFLHRDYHPVNLLWQDDKICGVVDWVNACRGPAGVDVAHCRGNLVGLYGVEAADRFLEHYQSLTGDSFVYDPYWDFASLVDGLPDVPRLYPPWLHFGMQLTSAMMQKRDEAWLTALLARL